MDLAAFSWGHFVVFLSEVVAAFLIFRLWRSNEHISLKILLSFIALIPVFGLIFVLWSINVPNPTNAALRDTSTYRADVYDRWSYIFNEKNPIKRYKAWRELTQKNESESS